MPRQAHNCWSILKMLETALDPSSHCEPFPGELAKNNSCATRGCFRLRTGWLYENPAVFVNIIIQTRGRKQHQQCPDVSKSETRTHRVCSGHLNVLSTLPVTCEILGKAVGLGGPGILVFNSSNSVYATGGGEARVARSVKKLPRVSC